MESPQRAWGGKDIYGEKNTRAREDLEWKARPKGGIGTRTKNVESFPLEGTAKTVRVRGGRAWWENENE
jgi:hypothetical protein